MDGSLKVRSDLRSGEGACPRDRCCPNSWMSDLLAVSRGAFDLSGRNDATSHSSSFRSTFFRPNKRLGVSFLFRVLLNYIILLSCIRFGEARHPGPSESPGVVVGTFNATGLLGKSKLVEELPPGLWGATETHLSKPGLAQFRKELQFCRTKQRFLTTSVAPLLSDSLGSVGGKATGVGLLSSYPCRNLPCQWPLDLQETARVHASAACIQNSWIRIGTFYGYAKCPKNKTTQSQSDLLLELLTDRIVRASQGFRVICGDFNQPIRALPQTEEWSKLGFVEIQEYAWQKWNRPIEFTSKSLAVRDYVWISPELIPYLESVHTDDSWFADHSILYARFRPFGSPASLPIWRKPLPLPWEVCGSTQDVHLPPDTLECEGDTSIQLKHLMNTVENCVDSQLRSHQQPGLLPNHRGRAATFDVSWGKYSTTPLKRGRNCDDAPTFTGEHFQHSQWLRQLRRIRSLLRLHTVVPLPPQKVDQAWLIWNSIKAAPGFPGGFRSWWVTRSCVTLDSPAVIPKTLPPLDQLHSIFLNFQVEFSNFEDALKKQRVTTGRERRLQDPTRIYRDIARPPAVPVSTLVVDRSCVVETISSDHLTIQFEPGTFDLSEPVRGPSGLLRCLEHSPGRIVLDQDQSLAVGDLLSQSKMCGSPDEIFQEFADMWTPIWDKHKDTPVEFWDSFISTQIPLLQSPSEHLSIQDLTVQSWLQAVQHKKVHTATGPDGISRMDLLMMPTQCTSILVDLLNQVERGLPWPSQLLVGLISSLEKKDTARSAADYRPICVLSLVYRTWASIRARQLLAWLIHWTPDSLIGSRPRKEAADVWFNIASAVEDGHYENLPIAGVSLDIQKCFNMLPCLPVFAVAKHLHLPDRVCVPWYRGLMHLQRRFVVTGLTGPAIGSSTGFPEGDPLSVVGMYLVNLVMTASLSHRCPRIIPWSYVDDWQLLVRHTDDAIHGYAVVCEFTQALQLPLDAAKSFFWATTSEERSRLRQGPLPVKLHARNLGGHISYSKISTNFTIVDRIRCCADFWKLLSRSMAPLKQKALALQVAAWPRCLHGVSGVMIASDWFCKLRSKALQSLRLDKPGTNPFVALGGILSPSADPEFFAIRLTVVSFRRFCVPDNAFPLLSTITQLAHVRVFPGPCGVFLSRLHSIGWQWLSEGWIQDHQGFRLHLLKCPIQTLLSRLEEAWYARISSEAFQRDGFSGFEHCDFKFSVEGLSSYSIDQQGLLRAVLGRSFFTRDRQFAYGIFVDASCPWCGEVVDSVHHRHWECKAFQSSRDLIPKSVFKDLPNFDECTLQRGWFPLPNTLRSFRQCLCEAPDLSNKFLPCDIHTDALHLFTDGSCLRPQDPLLRIASWGVVCADVVNNSFVPIACGPLPGLHQTIFRAEALAAISALRFGKSRKVPFWLWVDNQRVFDILTECRVGSPRIFSLTDKDHDLCQVLVDECRRAIGSEGFQTVVKVCSHQDRHLISDLVEDWAFRGNEAADHCAIFGRAHFPLGTFQLWEALVSHYSHLKPIRDELHRHFVRVGEIAIGCKSQHLRQEKQKWLQAGELLESGDDEPEVPISSGPLHPSFRDIDFQATVLFPEKFGSFADDVFQWLKQCVLSPEGTPQWVAPHQLLLDFQIRTGLIGCFRRVRDRTWHLYKQVDLEANFDFVQASRSFAAYVKAIAKVAGGSITIARHRPAGVSFKLLAAMYFSFD